MRVELTHIGERLAKGWGWTTDKSVDSMLKGMTHETRLECLLAAILARIRYIDANVEVMRINSNKSDPSDPSDPMADALLAMYRRGGGDVEITADHKKELSVRAKKVLSKAGVSFFGDINEAALLEVKNCGTKTVNEILEWKQRITGKAS